MSGGRQLPEPLAQGDLTRTPFAHVLLYVEKHALEGTLVVWHPESAGERPKQDRILFVGGVPVAGKLAEPAPRLDRGLLPLFARTNGPYAFYEHEDLVGAGKGVCTGEVAVLALITASLRGSSRDDVVAHVCAGFGASKLRLGLGVDLDRFGLLPEERAFIDLLRAEPTSVARLAEISPLPGMMAERLVYLLALTKSVAPWHEEAEAEGAASAAPAPAPPDRKAPSASGTRSTQPEATPARDAAPPPPPGLSSESRALWEEVAERAGAIEQQNYFEMLEISRDAATEAVQKAYFGLVKKWHPDRIPKELAPLRPFVDAIFGHLTRAQETLSDDALRGRYLAQVQDGGGTPEADRRLGRIIGAAMDFRKVEVLLRRREHAEALEAVEQCIAANPDEADYHAARGWILFQLESEPGHAAALASVDRALEIAETNDKALYYRGMILTRMGRKREAHDAFRRAADANPKNIEAVRMVRLAAMRGAEEAPAPAAKGEGAAKKSDSILGKLFGGGGEKKKK